MTLRIEITVATSPNGFMAEAWQREPSAKMLMAVRDYTTARNAFAELIAELNKKGWREIIPGLDQVEEGKA